MWATVLPIDVAKTRIQMATPGSPRDVGILRNLTMLHREGMPSLTVIAGSDTVFLFSTILVHCGALRCQMLFGKCGVSGFILRHIQGNVDCRVHGSFICGYQAHPDSSVSCQCRAVACLGVQHEVILQVFNSFVMRFLSCLSYIERQQK